MPDTEAQDAKRILVCTGKIGHELRTERQKRKDLSTAIVFLEQMYPFPEAELAAELERHSAARDIVWVQEEPANMGALTYMLPLLKQHRKRPPSYFGETFRERESGYRFGKGARGRAEDAAGPGVHHGGLKSPRDNPLLLTAAQRI